MRQHAEQQPGITQHDIADYVRAKMQVSYYVIKSVPFPISTIAKLVSSLSVHLKILVVQCMVQDDIYISSVICNNEWHFYTMTITTY